MKMRRIIVVTFLLLLAVSSAASLAAACCSSEHDMVTMQPMDDCPTAACCVTLAPLDSRANDQARPQLLATAPAGDAPAITPPHASRARRHRAYGPSPGAAQTTPVLLL